MPGAGAAATLAELRGLPGGARCLLHQRSTWSIRYRLGRKNYALSADLRRKARRKFGRTLSRNIPSLGAYCKLEIIERPSSVRRRRPLRARSRRRLEKEAALIESKLPPGAFSICDVCRRQADVLWSSWRTISEKLTVSGTKQDLRVLIGGVWPVRAGNSCGAAVVHVT